MRIVIVLAFFMVFAGCRSKKLAEVEQPEHERPVIEKETEIAVEVDADTGIMSLEERFTFTREDDKTRHDENTYFVIIGSFRSKDNAENYKESIRAKGFDPVILLSETGLHRVSVGSYSQENAARAQILEIRSRFAEHEDTWLLVRK